MKSSQAGLVLYSDSDTDEDDNIEAAEDGDNFQRRKESVDRPVRIYQGKRKSLAVPDDIVQMFQDVKPKKTPKRDNVQGRIRSFPHEEGDWPSFVYIPVNPCENLKALIEAVTKKANMMLPGMNSVVINDLHISLSKTVSLRHYWIDTILSKLKECVSGIQSFTYHLDLIEVYTNEENTRSFLGFRIIIGEEKLKKISQRIDEVLDEFGLPKYYENPIFHVSFAWYLGDVTKKIPDDFLENLQCTADSFDCEFEHQNFEKDLLSLEINSIFFKTGNKVFCLNT